MKFEFSEKGVFGFWEHRESDPGFCFRPPYTFASGNSSQRVVNFLERFSCRIVHFGFTPIAA